MPFIFHSKNRSATRARPSILSDDSIFVLALVLLWGALCLPLLGSTNEFKWEEGRDFFAAQSVLQGHDFFSFTVQGERFIRSPFFIWVVVGFAKILGSLNEITLRLPAALSVLAAGLFIYFHLRHRLSFESAFFAAGCFMTFPDVFAFSSIGEMATLMSLVILISVISWWRIYESPHIRVRDVTLFTSLLIIGNLTYWPTFPMILCAALFLSALLEKKFELVKVLVLSSVISIIPIAAWCIHNYQRGNGIIFIHEMTRLEMPITWTQYILQRKEILSGIMTGFSPWLPIAFYFILCMIYKGKAGKYFYNGLFTFVLLFVAVVVLTPQARPRFLIVCSPIVALVMGYAYFYFQKNGNARLVKTLQFLVIILVMIAIFYNSNFVITSNTEHSYNRKNAKIIDRVADGHVVYFGDLCFMNQAIYVKTKYRFISSKNFFNEEYMKEDALVLIRSSDYDQLKTNAAARRRALSTIAVLPYPSKFKSGILIKIFALKE